MCAHAVRVFGFDYATNFRFICVCVLFLLRTRNSFDFILYTKKEALIWQFCSRWSAVSRQQCTALQTIAKLDKLNLI